MLYYIHLSYMKDRIQGRNSDSPESHFLHRWLDGSQAVHAGHFIRYSGVTTLHFNLYSNGSEYHNSDICAVTYICIIQIFAFNCRNFCYILAVKLLYMFLNIKMSLQRKLAKTQSSAFVCIPAWVLLKTIW